LTFGEIFSQLTFSKNEKMKTRNSVSKSGSKKKVIKKKSSGNKAFEGGGLFSRMKTALSSKKSKTAVKPPDEPMKYTSQMDWYQNSPEANEMIRKSEQKKEDELRAREQEKVEAQQKKKDELFAKIREVEEGILQNFRRENVLKELLMHSKINDLGTRWEILENVIRDMHDIPSKSLNLLLNWVFSDDKKSLILSSLFQKIQK
jgi:hypothetical protein